jgi:hypothetical protein
VELDADIRIHPVPMPEPDELSASTVEFQIVRLSTREFPFEAAPLPIPEPYSELAFTCELETRTTPTIEIAKDREPYPLPIPEP